MKRRRTPMEALEIANARWWRATPTVAVEDTPHRPLRARWSDRNVVTSKVGESPTINGEPFIDRHVDPHIAVRQESGGAMPPDDPREEFRRILSRSQEQSLVDFFQYRHSPDCRYCRGRGHYFVDGKRILCMVGKT